MDPEHVLLHGHPRSMSCESRLCPDEAAVDAPSNSSSLETAIITTIFPATASQASPSLVAASPRSDDALEYSHQSLECLDLPAEAQIPLPPSPPGSDRAAQDPPELSTSEVLPQNVLQHDAITPETSSPPLELRQPTQLDQPEDTREEVAPVEERSEPEQIPLPQLEEQWRDESVELEISMSDMKEEVQENELREEMLEVEEQRHLDQPEESVEYQEQEQQQQEEQQREQQQEQQEEEEVSIKVEHEEEMKEEEQYHERQEEDYAMHMPVEEGPGLRVLGIPSEDPESQEVESQEVESQEVRSQHTQSQDTRSQDTPTQDVSRAFPLNLDSVLDVFRRSRHEAKRCAALKHAAYRQLHHHGKRRKLAHPLAYRHHQLVRCHREDYATEFSSLYAEMPDVRAGQALLETTSDAANEQVAEATAPEPAMDSSWISQLSDASQQSLLRLMNRIRSDEDYLATRIARLPPLYLEHLSRLHSIHTSDLSKLSSRSSGIAGSSRPPSRLSHMSETFETLDDIQRDPLQIMIHTLFDWTDGPDSDEALRREAIWSSVCARLIDQEVHGAERLVLAILDEFALAERWKLGPQLETLFLEWIQSGAFILDNDIVPMVKDEPDEVRKSRIAVAQTRFLETALEQLLGLLVDNVDCAVPVSCLNLMRSTLRKVQESRRERAKQIFITGWYCQIFLQRALVCPESHGLLARQHVRKEIRGKLLHPVYTRLLSTFEAVRIGYPADNGFTSALAMDRSQRIMAAFGVPRLANNVSFTSNVMSADLHFLNISGADMISLLVTLFPRADKSPDPSGQSIFGRAFSTTSSFIGGSRATTVGTLTPMFGTTSSAAPSTSSTSITSDTFFSEGVVGPEMVSISTLEDATAPYMTNNSVNNALEDSKYFLIARETRSLMDSLESKRTRRGSQRSADQTVALCFIGVDGQVSLQEPTPTHAADGPGLLLPEQAPLPDGYSQAALFDVLHLTLLEMMADSGFCASKEKLSQGAVDAVADYLANKARDAQASYDYISAHRFHKAASFFAGATLDQKSAVLHHLTNKAYRQSCNYESLCDMYEAWALNLSAKDKNITKQLDSIVASCRNLRDKQWFASVVCVSSEYMDALNIAKALATMATGKASKQRGLAGWAKRKLKASFGSDRARAQALALLSVSRQHGGPNKLTDSQAEITANWLTNNSIENFCSGEERVHRFCYEIQRCTRKLVADTVIASPVLWSSNLYEKEKTEFGGLQRQKSPWSSFTSSPTPRQGTFSGQSPTLPQASNGSRIFPFSLSPPHSRQASGIGRDFTSLQPHHTRPSILDSPIRFSTPPENALGLQTPWAFPPSPVSPNGALPQDQQRHQQQQQPSQLSPKQAAFLEDLRKTVTALLLSDLALSLWSNGSETDRWVNEERLHHESVSVKIGSPSHPDLTQLARSPPEASTADPGIGLYRWQRESSEVPDEEEQMKDQDAVRDERPKEKRFPYEDAYTKLLTRVRLSPDPYEKLDALLELVRLIALAPSISDEDGPSGSTTSLASQLRSQYAAGLPNRSIPRTGLTKLQEVTINCEERRIQSLSMTPVPRGPVPYPAASSLTLQRPTAADGEWLGDSKISNVIQALLLDRAFYPSTLFRDLQMISAFVPSSFLDNSPQGSAFWTIGLAAMQLKSALCAAMIDRAAQITNFHVDRGNKLREPVRQDRSSTISSRPAGQMEQDAAATAAAERHRAASPNRNYKSRTLNEGELRMTGLADAGRLFRIAALEGDPAAARELGLFYLTHPEHVLRTLRPLSKPSEVARMAGSAPTASDRGVGSSMAAAGMRQESQLRSGGGRLSEIDGDDEMHVDVPEVTVDGRDPGNLATAWHWMESAADGGDEQAKTFLMNNTELRWDAQGRRI